MKRRTIDLVVSAAGLVIGVILLIAGFVLTSNANFAKNYVHDQLAQEQISFKTADTLTDLEKAKPCLVQYAGQELLTGKQAECYANSFIGLHLSEMGAGTPYAGHSYAALGDDANAVKAQITAATTAGDTAKVADLNKTLTAVNAQRDTVFKGEMLRTALLTSYGFSELGAKAALGATVAYAGAGVMFLLGLLGLWHGARTSPSQAFAPVEPAAARREKSDASA